MPIIETEIEDNMPQALSSYGGQCVARALLLEAMAGARDICHFIENAIAPRSPQESA